MSAWKSSDGGAIASIGAEQWRDTLSLGKTIVSAAENVNGIVLRTAVLFNASSVLGSISIVRGGEDVFLLMQDGAGVKELGRELHIPAGVELKGYSASTDAFAYVTWDFLT